eukprot:symbB.v1.2.027669.t1/scaffold2851.1/size68913/6
MDLGSLFSGLT